ncbi:MAG: elongation factor P [Candidatus Liptonbacteria bacterium]|nr:elongation factor P [Candidatus Liptonbacteria bacterium]
MSLSYTDLRKGVFFVMNGEPYEVLEAHFLRMQQRKAVVQTKIRNLMTGKVFDRNFQPSDNFDEADMEKKEANFIYKAKGECWFHEIGKPGNRFSLKEELVGEAGQFLKQSTQVTTLVFNEKVIGVTLPVKMELKVTEAPPAIRGNTAQGGTKVVTLETGAKISVPLFVDEGDVVKVNTETGEYVERVQ